MGKVYTRTEAGQWAAYNADSALPRKLKSLLLMINGSASEELYAQSLASFGDVRSLLDSLVMAGLVEVVGESQSVPASSGQPPRPTDMRQRAPGASVPQPTDIFSTTQPVAARPSAAQPEFSGMLGLDAAADEFSPTLAAGDMQAARPAMPEPEVILARRQMQSFLNDRLPELATNLGPQIQEIHTKQDLAVLLDGYAMLVSRAGEAAPGHIASLRNLVYAPDATHAAPPMGGARHA